jgi:hypothetical protein
VGCREQSRESYAPCQAYPAGEIFQLFGFFSVGCRERSREPCALRQAYPTGGVLLNHFGLSLRGVESEAVSLVLSVEPTLRERSPHYLDPSPWGAESEATSLVLPVKPTLRKGFSPIILIFLCGV